MEEIKHILGSKRNYTPAEMQGSIFFSKDTKEILLNNESYGNATPADEEDLTAESGTLKLKDRSYDEANFLGKGYKILRKNIVDGKNILTLDMISDANTIYEIRYDFDLSGETITIPEGCTLKFEGGSFSNGVLSGLGVSIYASLQQIFSSVKLLGTYSTKFYIEWFGASSSKNHNEVYINLAIESFPSNAGEGTIESRISNVLVFSGRYEINDTIYVSGLVSFEGLGLFYRGKYVNSSSSLIVNFTETDKWVIDTKYSDGTIIPYNKLTVEDTDSFNISGSLNITGIHIVYATNAPLVYGGIRLYNMQHSKVSDLDLSGGFVVGLALLKNNWNLEIRNTVIYSRYCSLYLGKTTTTITMSNVYLLKNGETEVATPTYLDTSKPPYLDSVDSTAMILEGAAVTAYGCIFQGFGSIAIGTDYNLKLDTPYIELIADTFIWLHATKLYRTDTKRNQVIIDNALLGLYKTNSYALGTYQGMIEVFNFMYSTCYTPDTPCYYPTYLIHVNGCSDMVGTMYYDTFQIDETGEVVSASKSPFKQIILEGALEKSKFIDMYIRPDIPETVPYRNLTLLSGYSYANATTFKEILRRKHDRVSIHPVANNTLIISDNIILQDKHIKFETFDVMAHLALFGEPLSLQNSRIDYIDSLTTESINYMLAKEEISSLHNIYGKGNKITLSGYWSVLSSTHFVTLCGNQEVSLEVEIQGRLLSDVIFNTAEAFISNPEFSAPYNIVINYTNSSGVLHTWRYSNQERPTIGLYDGCLYFDQESKKILYWNGSLWIDPTENISWATIE